MNSALIIGGTGLLGRGIAEELLRAGWKVAIQSRGKKEMPAELASCQPLIADRRHADGLQQVCRDYTFDLVVDCSAYNRQDAEAAHAAFRGKVAHYWFISSDFVYANDPTANYPIAEGALKQIALPYAAGKLETEAFLLETNDSEAFPVTLLRPPHILGKGRPAGCDPAAGGRDANLANRLRGGESISLLADGQFLIQPIWCREVGRCILELYGQSKTFGQLLNITGAECITTMRYYEIIAELCGVELKMETVSAENFVRDFPEKAHLARHRIYDTTKLRELGFVPKLSLKDALKETIDGCDPNN